MKRLFFPLVALFWVIMNVLLWRSEMSGARDAGTPVPPSLVWERILSAPDDSSLGIEQAGQKVGYCRWQATVGEAGAKGSPAVAEDEVEGRVRRPANYSISFGGNLRLPEAGQPVRFDWRAEFTTNHTCRKFSLRLTSRPNLLDLRADFATQTLKVLVDNQGPVFERTFTFEELNRPDALLASLGLPFAGGFWGQATGRLGLDTNRPLALGLSWDARSDWMKIGQARARVYRLQARLLDRYQAVVTVSRVGEILRVELPGEIVLLNEALQTL